MRSFYLTVALSVALAAGCAGKAKETAPPAPAEEKAPAFTEETRELPPPTLDGGLSLNAALAARRSTRTYGDRKLTDAEVGQLLWAGQGITSAEGFRTAPSAGALYPMTLYWADDAGLWRYDAKKHLLVRVTGEDRRPALARAGLDQAPLKRAPGVIIIVAQPSVTAAKYGARAERYGMLEAGHVGQNILLTATALGLGACPVGAFADDEVNEALGLDGRYLPLLLIPVGDAFRG